MVLYFSGSTGGNCIAEEVLADRNVGVMLTYFEIKENKFNQGNRINNNVEKTTDEDKS